MTGAPEDDLLQRRARITSAALRAAYAWSARSQEQRAFEEICRMTGVVMLELGPGHGPATPTDLVRSLHQPLGGLLPGLPAADEGRYGRGIDEVVLLAGDGTLTDAAYEIGSDYVRDVVAAWDPGREWLPGWSWMRANDVEAELFDKLKAAGGEAAYTAARRFVVEHAAGGVEAMAAECNRTGAPRVAGYVPITEGQSFRDGRHRWWWPCQVCGWAMDVHGRIVRCRYPYHFASYQVSDRGNRGPALLAVDQRLPTGVPLRLPSRHDVAESMQVEEPVWRFIVVPGATEVRLWRLLTAAGAQVTLYPSCDRYDLDISVGDRLWDVDLKEHATVEGLLRSIREKPAAARFIVLPDTHRGQQHALDEALPGYRVLTEEELIKQVKAALRRQKRSAA